MSDEWQFSPRFENKLYLRELAKRDEEIYALRAQLASVQEENMALRTKLDIAAEALEHNVAYAEQYITEECAHIVKLADEALQKIGE